MVFGQAFWSERPSEGGLETEASAPVREAGRSRKRASFLLGQAFRSEGPSGGGLETEASASVEEASRSRKRASFLLRHTFRSEIGSPFWPAV